MATPPSPSRGSMLRWLMLLPVLPFAVKIVQEYERGVIFRLGRLVGAWGPGLFLIIPVMERMVVVDLRVITMDVPRQDAITRDNVTVRVDAVVYFRVVDPEAAVTKVADYIRATSLIAQTSLRNVIGQSELDELLSRRDEINLRLQQIIDEATEPWGIKVTATEVRDVSLPTEMVRAIARQAEVERERRAKIIHAEGELQAAGKLAEAGKVMAASPASMQLRYLQTLSEMAGSGNTTVIPFPIDIVTRLASALTAGQTPATDTDQGNGSAQGKSSGTE
ncbi:MAG: slipin family protein [Dehalococcoidia bacterium]